MMGTLADPDDDNDKPPNGGVVITNKEEASYETEQLRMQVFIYYLFCLSFFSS